MAGCVISSTCCTCWIDRVSLHSWAIRMPAWCLKWLPLSSGSSFNSHSCLKQKRFKSLFHSSLNGCYRAHQAIIYMHNKRNLKLIVFWKSFAHFCLLPWRPPAHIWKHIWRPSHSISHNWHKTTNTSKRSYTMSLFELYHHASWTTESQDQMNLKGYTEDKRKREETYL